MEGSQKFLLIDTKALPEVFIKVAEAKALLKQGTAKSASDAAKMSGISRSAFYKYKDYIFFYDEKVSGRILTINLTLIDAPGVLARVVNSIHSHGLNVLTLNQNIPVSGLAAVSISARVENLTFNVEEFVTTLRVLEGVNSIDSIIGE